MAFVNEYIQESDYEKYDLRRICGEHNLAHRGQMHSRSWVVDRERHSFLIKTWAHRESDSDGWAFYWQGEWLFFEMTPTEGWGMPDGSACRFLFQVKGLVIPNHLEHIRETLFSDLRAAITACPGSPTFNYVTREVSVEFVGE